MVTARCQCGALIGGEHHVSVEDNKDMGGKPNLDIFTPRGYSYSKADLITRIPLETLTTLRLIVHICLFLSLELGFARSLMTLLYGHETMKRVKKDVEDVKKCEFLCLSLLFNC
jgi:hypothetical protein